MALASDAGGRAKRGRREQIRAGRPRFARRAPLSGPCLAHVVWNIVRALLRRIAMSCRLLAALLLFVTLPLASAQEGKKEPETKKEPAKYEDVLQTLVDTMGKMTKTLAIVV